MKLIPLFLAVFPFVTSLPGQVLGARPLPPVNQVASPEPAPARGAATDTTANPAPATVSRRFTEWDGFTITKLVLNFERGAAIEINQERFAGWQRTDRAPFALAFTHSSAGDACLGISYFSGAAAGNLLAGTAWGSTPSSLALNPKDSTARVLVNDDSSVNPSMRRPLSWRTRVFEREITSTAPGRPSQRQLRVAIGNDTQAYLFTLEGTAGEVTDLKPAFERVVTSFELVR